MTISIFPQAQVISLLKSSALKRTEMMQPIDKDARSSFPATEASPNTMNRKRRMPGTLNSRNHLVDTICPFRKILERRKVTSKKDIPSEPCSNNQLPATLPFASQNNRWGQWRRHFQSKRENQTSHNSQSRRRCTSRQSNPQNSISTCATFDIFMGDNPSEQWSDFVFDSDQEDQQRDLGESLKWSNVVQS